MVSNIINLEKISKLQLILVVYLYICFNTCIGLIIHRHYTVITVIIQYAGHYIVSQHDTALINARYDLFFQQNHLY